MGVSSCAQDDGLQPRHRLRQPFMSIADGRFRGLQIPVDCGTEGMAAMRAQRLGVYVREAHTHLFLFCNATRELGCEKDMYQLCS